MKNSFLLLFTILLSVFSYAQENDSINILFNSEWKVSLLGLHPRSYEITLTKVRPKEDSLIFIKFRDSLIVNGNLSSKQINRFKKIKLNNDYGEFVMFDSISNVSSIVKAWCHVGNTYYRIVDFKLHHGKVIIGFSKKVWNQPQSKKEDKYIYDITKWNKNQIVLTKQK